MYETTADELHQEMLNQMDESYQKTVGFPTYDLLRAMAVVLAPFGGMLDQVAAKLDVDNLTGEELRRFVAQNSSITFKAATYSSAVLTVSGNGTVKQGDIFETEGGVQFAANEATEVEGSADIMVTALLPGPAGNVGAGSITLIPKTIQGITSCTNRNAATGGYAEETDSSLRERYYEAKQTPATSGNVWHYKKWAREVPGVGDAKVFSLWNGENTVQVVIIDDQKKPADSTLVEDVQEHIDPGIKGTGEGEAPIGAYCTVTAAEALEINVSVTLILASGYTSAGITEYIEAYLKSIAFKQNYVSTGRIGNAILDSPGVIDYADLMVNGGTANITVPEKSVAVLGTVNVNVSG